MAYVWWNPNLSMISLIEKLINNNKTKNAKSKLSANVSHSMEENILLGNLKLTACQIRSCPWPKTLLLVKVFSPFYRQLKLKLFTTLMKIKRKSLIWINFRIIHNRCSLFKGKVPYFYAPFYVTVIGNLGLPWISNSQSHCLPD